MKFRNLNKREWLIGLMGTVLIFFLMAGNTQIPYLMLTYLIFWSVYYFWTIYPIDERRMKK